MTYRKEDFTQMKSDSRSRQLFLTGEKFPRPSSSKGAGWRGTEREATNKQAESWAAAKAATVQKTKPPARLMCQSASRRW